MQKKSINNVRFAEVADEWLQFKKNRIKESTYLNYKYIIHTKFMIAFGRLSLKELLNYNFNLYIENLMKKLSNKTVRDIIAVLKGILRYTEMKYEIDFKLRLISSPAIYKKDIEIFSDYDRKKLEKVCKNSDKLKHLGVLISLYAGLRIGEICALKWSDIDLDGNCIYVAHTLQRVYVGKAHTKILYTVPKTQKSIRKIPIAKALQEKLTNMSKKYPEEAFILTGKEDKWAEPLGYRETYKTILKGAKVKYKKYHVLRHTFATRCINVGMDTKSLSEILGHANVNITLNTYVHSSFEIKTKYMNRL